VERIGIGEPRRERRARHVRGKGRQGAGERVGGQFVPGEIGFDGRLRATGPRAGQQAMAGADDLGEQVVLGFEMGVEGTAGQAGRQHDVVDVGAAIAAQPEQPGGVVEDFGPGPGLAGGALGHSMSIIISYDD
jgi:hypothetical protein